MGMTRPLYETPEDLEHEISIQAIIESHTGWHLYKMPIKYYADFIAWEKALPYKNPVAIIEAKQRKVALHDHKAYILSLHKTVNVLEYCEFLSVPFYLFIKWTDAFGYTEITKASMNNIMHLGQLTKSYRNDPSDIEPCVFIPIETFQLIT